MIGSRQKKSRTRNKRSSKRRRRSDNDDDEDTDEDISSEITFAQEGYDLSYFLFLAVLSDESIVICLEIC